MSLTSGKILFTVNNFNDFSMPLNIDMMFLSVGIDFSVSNIGLNEDKVSGTERVELKDVFVVPDNSPSLLSDKVFFVKANTAISFKTKYSLKQSDLANFVKNEMAKKGNAAESLIGSTVAVKRMIFELNIPVNNPQTNKNDTLRSEFTKDKLLLGFVL